MKDPIFDEDMIIKLLKSPPNNDSVGTIQSGAVQACIDMFDRGVTRDFFIDHAATCFALYGQAAKMWILSNIEEAHDSGALSTVQFAIARDGIADMMRKMSEQVIETVKRAQECPTTRDKVH